MLIFPPSAEVRDMQTRTKATRSGPSRTEKQSRTRSLLRGSAMDIEGATTSSGQGLAEMLYLPSLLILIVRSKSTYWTSPRQSKEGQVPEPRCFAEPHKFSFPAQASIGLSAWQPAASLCTSAALPRSTRGEAHAMPSCADGQRRLLHTHAGKCVFFYLPLPLSLSRSLAL